MEIKYPSCISCKYAQNILKIFEKDSGETNIYVNCVYPLPDNIKIPDSISKKPILIGFISNITWKNILVPNKTNCPCYEYDDKYTEKLLQNSFSKEGYEIQW